MCKYNEFDTLLEMQYKKINIEHNTYGSLFLSLNVLYGG
jgi:hypothetical protein